MAKQKQNTDHVTFRNGQPFCLNCGQKYVINLPAPIPVAVGAMNGFIKAHANCPKTWEPPVVDLSQTVSERALWWFEYGDCGISSHTIFSKLTTVKRGFEHPAMIKKLSPRDWHHPRDPSDFRRCHLLLEALPELRAELAEMKEVSPVWSALVDHWDKLTAMVLAEPNDGKSMYEFMKELGC